MSYRASYVPKRKRLNYKVVIPLLVLLLLVAYTGYTLLFKKPVDKVEAFTICGLKPYDTRQLIKGRQELYKQGKEFAFSDYGVYGESLSVYQNPYDAKTPDPIIGNMVFLTNLCGTSLEDKDSFLMSKELDMRITFSNLKDGFYEIDVMSDLNSFRLLSESLIDETFSSVAHDGKVKEIRLVANKDLFNSDGDQVLDKNYAYLEVKSVESKDNTEIDIVLDPSGGTLYDNGSINYGASYRDMSEYTEMYKVAEGVKAVLEAQGLRVKIARDSQTGINVFGEKGRIAAAYEAKAKYYVQLRFEVSGSSNDKGLISFYSNFATNRFATNITKKITAGTSVQTTIYDDGKNIKGVYQTMLNNQLDYSDIIRETGGKFTGAGTTEGFVNSMAMAKDSRRGMNTISILYGYMTDEQDYNTWLSERDKVIQETASGIMTQLGSAPKGE